MTVVGAGLIASEFAGRHASDDTVLFASGVSNSKETRSSEFDRERDLLCRWLQRSNRLVYFSTCSVEDISVSKSSYVAHKRNMEDLVLSRSTCANLVVRLPQVIGRSNNINTIVNFFVSRIVCKERYDLYQGTIRNFIDVSDVVELTNYLFRTAKQGGVYSFAMPESYEVTNVVSILEILLQAKSLHDLKVGVPFEYPESSFIREAVQKKVIDCGPDYLNRVLYKYFSDFDTTFSGKAFVDRFRGVVDFAS